MKKTVSTKKALLTGVLSLVLCCAMLIGTTFAWFTDAVAGGKNILTAGTLDIELEYYTETGWTVAEETTDLFTGTLWEPGHTEVIYLRLSNLGSLALKYELGVHVVSETVGKTESGTEIRLSDHLVFGVAEGQTPTYSDREAAISSVAETSQPLSVGYTRPGRMAAGAPAQYLALVVYMPGTVGNEANYRGEDIPAVDLGLTLFATQYTDERDSFGNDYDAAATWDVTSYAALQTAFEHGGHVSLGADISLTGADTAWDYNDSTGKAAHLYIPAGIEVTLDLNGHTLTNTHISSSVRWDVIANYGTLTLIDSVGTGKLISTNNTGNVQASGGFAVYSGGDLVLRDVAIDSNTGSYAVYIEGEGNTLTVDDATVSGRGALAVYNGAHGIVNSGDFSIDVLTANARDNVLALYNATAEVYGGNFDGTLKTLGSNDSFNWKGSSCVMLMGSTSTAYVYGGTFEAREADLFSHGSGCKVYAYGGTFNTVNALGNSALHEHNANALVEVCGGSFIYDPTDYIGEGYAVMSIGGRYTVIPAE